MSAQAKQEYVQVIYRRYRHAGRPEKRRILDEFCQVAAYHRKHAIRLLSGPAPGATPPAAGAAGVRSHNVTSDLGGYPLDTVGARREMLDCGTPITRAAPRLGVRKVDRAHREPLRVDGLDLSRRERLRAVHDPLVVQPRDVWFGEAQHL